MATPTARPTPKRPAAKRTAAAKRTTATKRRGPLAFAGRFIRALVLLVVGYVALCAGLLVAYRAFDPPATTVHVQRLAEGLAQGGLPRYRYTPVAAEAMDADIRHAAVAAEDTRFYAHGGFDWEELRIAREEAERRGTPMRGASTITQQLVKNLFLTTHRSFVRKGFEVPLTLLAEFILPKERILTLYLNVAEWGPGVFGAEEAARFHYDTGADALTRSQAARLAAVLPDPLGRTPQEMSRTAARIQTRMRQLGW